MGRYVKTRIVTDGLIYLNDAGNSKSYSGVGTAIKNLVGYGATNTSFNQTFVSSGTSSYFVSTGSTSYISNTNVSVSASTGRGFTICMMIKPQSLNTSDGWNYWFQQSTSNSLVEFGVISDGSNSYPLNSNSGRSGWQMKNNAKQEGQKVFTSIGTTTWTVPVGVTTITAVCIGGGGGGGGSAASYPAAGGGGGGLSFGSTISVTPGDVLYIRVGAGGTGGRSYDNSPAITATAGSAGQSSYIKTGSHSGTSLLEAGGGGGGGTSSIGGAVGGAGGTSTGTARTNGGTGGVGGSNAGGISRGAGGGGAAGYTGNGGDGRNGGTSSILNGYDGSGGGGGGGGNSTISISDEVYNSGGGVGLFGQGENGTGGTGSTSNVFCGGSGGSGGSRGSASTSSVRSVGGLYGGGGGTKEDTTSDSVRRDGGDGGQGAVRIVWGSGRFYPDTNTSNPIPVTQYAELTGGYYGSQGGSTDWNFVVCGVTTNYYTFISTNGSTKTLGSSNDWNNSDQINFDKIFGTGTNNYSCLWNNCMIYNRELTNEEIQINFEAFGRKFNL